METSGLYFLDTTTRSMIEARKTSKDLSKYAILSHRWDGNETSLQKYQKLYESNQEKLQNADLTTTFGSTDDEKALEKIAKTCWLAQRDKLEYAWIDTCCINKENATEQEKDFASMYKYYEAASLCYVYLNDVSDMQEEYEQSDDGEWIIGPFKNSKWFTRGIKSRIS